MLTVELECIMEELHQTKVAMEEERARTTDQTRELAELRESL